MLLTIRLLSNQYTVLKRVRKVLEDEQDFQRESNKEKKEPEKDKKKPFLPKVHKFSLDTQKHKIITAAFDICQYVEDLMAMSSPAPAIVTLHSIVPVIKERLSHLETLEDCLSYLGIFMPSLELFFEGSTSWEYSFNEYNYIPEWRRRFQEWYDGDSGSQKVIQLLRDAISCNRDTNALDLYCCDGSNLISYKNGRDSVNLYGLAATKTVFDTEKQFFKRLVYGGIDGTKMTNGAFDVAICRPPLSFTLTMRGNVYEKLERKYLERTLTLMRPGGAVLYVLPYFRFHKEICTMLAKNLKDVQIFTTTESMTDSKTIMVLGVKKPNNDKKLDQSLYANLRNLAWDWANIATINPEHLETIEISGKYIPVDTFRGSVLDEDEIEALFNHSNCTKEFWKNQEADNQQEEKKHPELPFSVGHLGLVMTSGCLDGLIDEGDGHYHVIKGRVVKRKDYTNSVSAIDNRIQIIETTSNHVEINAFLPDGTYKCLA